MTPENTYTLTQLAGGTVFGALGLTILLQKFLTVFKTDKTENSVISLMHAELERMSKQNITLSEELGKLQQEVIELNKELRILTAENQRLHAEVQALTHEIARFKEVTNKLAE